MTTSAADSAGVAQQLLRYLLGALDGASRKGTRLVGRRRSRRVLFGGPRGSNSPFATSTWCHVSPTRAPLLIPLSLYDYYGAQRPPRCPARPPRRPWTRARLSPRASQLRRTRLLARCVDVEQGGRGARDMGRDGREGQRGSDTSWCVDRYELTRACSAVSFCHPSSSVCPSDRSDRSIGSDRSDRIG